VITNLEKIEAEKVGKKKEEEPKKTGAGKRLFGNEVEGPSSSKCKMIEDEAEDNDKSEEEIVKEE
jgi:hypothetical protein